MSVGSLGHALSVAASGLFAAQKGAFVSGDNAANSTTEGFHRRTVTQTPLAIGGVGGQKIYRAQDPMAWRGLLGAAAGRSYANTYAAGAARVEQATAMGAEQSIDTAIGAFFGAWQELAANPTNTPNRTEVLDRASNVGSAFALSREQLVTAQQSADTAVISGIKTANSLLHEIGGLNGQIASAEAKGDEASSLRDARDVAVQKLSDLIGVTAQEDDFGNLTVRFADGLTLVERSTVRDLVTAPQVGGLSNVLLSGGSGLDVSSRLRNGSIGAELAVRDDLIAPAIANLDTIASDFVTAVNAVHSANFGTDGVSGRALFGTVSVPGAAAAVALDAAVVGQPQAVAAAAGGVGTGDNSGALAMVALTQQAVSSGATLAGALANLTATLGVQIRNANVSATQASSRFQQMLAIQESTSGVSIEEETLQLTRYQQAFTAATRVVETIRSMMDDLVRM